MKELGLQELLRYALSGGVGIVALRVMYPTESACLIRRVQGTGEVTLVLGAILVFGSLVYNIHRAVLFPPIFRWLGRMTLLPNRSRPIGNWWVPSKEEMDIDRWRWNLGEIRLRRWNEWGAQTHFLYCAAWATLLAFIVGHCNWGWRCRSLAGILAAVFLFSAGIVNNYRLLYSMNAERESEREETKNARRD
jgi:hypothetical protein